MAATDKPGWDTLFSTHVDGFVRVEFGNLDAVKAAICDKTVAVMVEPIQGEAGVVVPPDGFLSALREVTRDNNLLLILDEIQTGMGRTGPLFAFQGCSVAADIVTLGKGIGGGVPLAALLARDDVSCFEPGDQGGTFNGNPLMMAVGLAVLDAVTDADFVANAKHVSEVLRSELERLAGDLPGSSSVRGAGHLLAVSLSAEASSQIAAACFDAGLLVNAPRPDTLRFMPSLATTEQEVHEMIAILEPIAHECVTRSG